MPSPAYPSGIRFDARINSARVASGDPGAREWGEILRADHVTRLIAEVAAALDIGSAIDPFAVSPAILGSVPTIPGARRLAVTPDPATAQIAEEIFPHEAQWALGDPFDPPNAASASFDWIVSSPPVGLRRRDLVLDGLPAPLARSDPGLAPLWTKLPEVQVGALVMMTEAILWRQPSWLDAFQDLGFHLRSAISVPGGLAPATAITGLLCEFRREPVEALFVARATPTTDLAALVRNLAQHEPAKFIELGALIPHGEFVGWSNLKAARLFEAATKHSPAPLVRLGDLMLDTPPRSVDGSAGPEGDAPAANAIYFNPGYRGRWVLLQPPDATKGQNRIIEIQLDPSKALAPFVAGWLNGETGRLTQTSLGHPFRPLLTPTTAQDIVVPAPPIKEQARTARVGARLATLRDEASRLEELLWGRPWNIDEMEDGLALAVSDDPLGRWVESLPFPLASIAHRYAAEADTAGKIDKLHFLFEAFAQYMAIVALSMCRRHPDLWERERAHLIADRSVPLDRPDFGLWLQIASRLGKTLRRARDDARQSDQPESDRKDALRSMFGIADSVLIDAVIEKKLNRILQEARTLRNTTKAHGGLSEGALDAHRLAQLEDILEQVREATAHAFRRTDLVQPGDGRRSNGVRTYAKARVLRGPVNVFRERELVTPSALDFDAEALCVVDIQEGLTEDALELLPLVRMRPSPGTEMNAAYFYNRRESDGFHFVSYHFPAEDDAPLDDPGLAALMSELDGG